MKFRPCIDIHNGRVKQIVGATLSDDNQDCLVTNFESSLSPAYYAKMYKSDNLPGGHVIMLGPGNETAALEALAAYQDGLMVGGGINPQNAKKFIDAGASHVIVTSYVFRDGLIIWERIDEMVKAVGRDNLVLDLSCRRKDDNFVIVTDRWQKFSSQTINHELMEKLGHSCDEFLVHAADVEGMKNGIDSELVELLAQTSPLAVTYAGGIRSIEDFEKIKLIGDSKVDATVGSALDIFGGTLSYSDVVKWNNKQRENDEKPA
ncbi:Phosphoribosylformimino-5-aminoimidazole carboxamide ribotide isomerase [Chitinispirillum alkaliphilum]|nr:Phosphoribosylformimino-5-aminoimidazole carboxamide ribotide isomerase [Chitinispirillum alkaliphilum]